MSLSAFATLGGAIGGAVLGSILAALSLIVSLAGHAAVTIFAALGVALAATAFHPAWDRLVPFRDAQVPLSWWLNWTSLRRTALAWGVVLGSGALTKIVTPALYALFLALVISSPLVAFAGGVAYGIFRAVALTVAIIATRSSDRAIGVGLNNALRLPTVLATGGVLVAALL